MTTRTVVRARRGAPQTSSQTPQPVPSIVGRKPGAVTSLKGVFFGPPKTGKTVAATSGRNVLLVQFDPDGDSATLLQGRDDITVVEPKSHKEITDIVQAVATTDAGRFDWVVFDSTTFWFQMLGGKDIMKAYRANTDPRRAYTKPGAEVASTIYDLLQLEQNVIFTAHLQKEDDTDGAVAQETELGEHQVKLAVTPMIWKVLGPGVTFIGRTYKKVRNKEATYHVSLNDGERSPAGARIALPGHFDITSTLLHDLQAERQKEAQ